jgi:hypothetical protein
MLGKSAERNGDKQAKRKESRHGASLRDFKING